MGYFQDIYSIYKSQNRTRRIFLEIAFWIFILSLLTLIVYSVYATAIRQNDTTIFGNKLNSKVDTVRNVISANVDTSNQFIKEPKSQKEKAAVRIGTINGKNIAVGNNNEVGDKTTINNYERPIRRLQSGEGLKIWNEIYKVAKENNIKSVNRVVVQFNYKDGVRTPTNKYNLATDIADYLKANHFNIDFQTAFMMGMSFPDTAYTVVSESYFLRGCF